MQQREHALLQLREQPDIHVSLHPLDDGPPEDEEHENKQLPSQVSPHEFEHEVVHVPEQLFPQPLQAPLQPSVHVLMH